MIHDLTIGHFDVEALKDRRLIVLQPLDLAVVIRILREVGHIGEDGRLTLGGHAVTVKEGYIVCPWLMAQRFVLLKNLQGGCRRRRAVRSTTRGGGRSSRPRSLRAGRGGAPPSPVFLTRSAPSRRGLG